MWKKISVGGVVYFTVLCDHPYLVSLLFAVLVSLHPVTFSNVFYYLYTQDQSLRLGNCLLRQGSFACARCHQSEAIAVEAEKLH